MDLKGAKILSFGDIGRAFLNEKLSEEKYVNNIPHYQRPYKWTQENIKNLIEDWSNNQEDSSYFCGSTVAVINKSENNDITHLNIIDGQQRYTTLYLSTFISFLISIELVKASLSQIDYSQNFKEYFDEMKEILGQLVKLNDGQKDSLNKYRKELVDARLIEQKKLVSPEEVKDIKKISAINIFNSLFNESYFQSLFSNDSVLYLRYDRPSYNKSLKKILSKSNLVITDSACFLEIVDEEEEESFSKNEVFYVNSLEILFELFRNRAIRNIGLYKGEYLEGLYSTEGSSQLVNTLLSMINELKKFKAEIQVCMIQTGEPDDAYTLFEVLNDRSLALDDLDLIKNQFYKHFVNQGSDELSDLKKDDILQKLDELWVNSIFDGDTQYKNDLIAYLALVYITGSSNIKFDNSKDYRQVIKSHFEDLNYYDSEKLGRDFNVFLVCKILIEAFSIQKNFKDLNAIEAECDSNVSTSGKLVKLLYAMDYVGVLSGFTSFILHKIEGEVEGFKNIKLVEKMLKDLYNTDKPGLDLSGFSNDCNKQAKEIWSVSMMSADYSKPKEFTDQIILDIKKLNIKGVAIDIREITVSENVKLLQAFDKWLEGWKFNKNKNDKLKLRMLFSILIRCRLEDSKVKFQMESSSNSVQLDYVKNIEIDHMEPESYPKEKANEYFEHHDRVNVINSLGNMMPLFKTDSTKKILAPLNLSWERYENGGFENHFLYLESKNIFTNNSKVKSGSNVATPELEFFDQRNLVLKGWIKDAMSIYRLP